MIIMNAKTLSGWTTFGMLMLTLTKTPSVWADDANAAVLPHKSYTGKLVAMNAKERTLELKGAFLRKKFNLGDHCAYTMEDKSAGAISDLRPGQRVTVAYQESQGVRVVDRVTQQPQTCDGTVKAFDPTGRTLVLHGQGVDRTLQIADDCKVMLRDYKPGTLADLQIGNYVTVTYETPNDKLTAWKIAQTSESFTGTLTAIDLEAKTVKAKALFDTRKFTLGDNCAIVINGRLGGQLADLKPNDKLVISYDEINGINVANRIAPAGSGPPSGTTATQPVTP